MMILVFNCHLIYEKPEIHPNICLEAKSKVLTSSRGENSIIFKYICMQEKEKVLPSSRGENSIYIFYV